MAQFKPAYATPEERAYRAGVFDANKAVRAAAPPPSPSSFATRTA